MAGTSKRSNAIIEITDGDRGIELTLSCDYDWLPEGAVEEPSVEVIRGIVWFGKYGANLDMGDNGRGIARDIEGRYHDEIVQAVLDVRAAMEDRE